MGKKEYTNKDKQKELKKFFDAKRKKNFSGVVIKPSKKYKGKINNLALPEIANLDAIEKEIKKEELQKKRYGRELKENEIEVRVGGLITKKYANPVKVVDNRKKKK